MLRDVDDNSCIERMLVPTHCSAHYEQMVLINALMIFRMIFERLVDERAKNVDVEEDTVVQHHAQSVC